ncbi:hypothetical protein BDF19DRAFT_430645 [Syncephalis fuscata]|nr:hypothetical protein BDF19DRAFT_430645 [Syncephalis fuscata]
MANLLDSNISIVKVYREFGSITSSKNTVSLIKELKQHVDMTATQKMNGQLVMGVHVDLPVDVYLQMNQPNASSRLMTAPFLANLEREATTRLSIANHSLTEARGITGDAFLVEHVPRFSSSSNSLDALLCTLTHRKSNGKVITETTHITFEPQGDIDQVTAYEPPSVSIIGANNDGDNSSNSATQKESNPAAHLPFNLTLTDEQREAKDKLLLPYLKAQEHTAAVTTGAGAVTSIYYTPDSDDDFDEEDPDDDLEI